MEQKSHNAPNNTPTTTQPKRTIQHDETHTPTKRIKLIPNNNKKPTKTTQTEKINTKQIPKPKNTTNKTTQKQCIAKNSTKPAPNYKIPLSEPQPNIAKMKTAEIIQNTYVEYLPNGTKRDRYRKEYLKQLQLTNNNSRKKEISKHKKQNKI